jgi:DNA-binding PadR family transcriptional regulator
MENQVIWPSGRELEVLRILQTTGRAMIGLDIAKASGGTIDRAAIYVYLGRLEEKGFLTVKRPERADHPGMPRPIYKINGLGEKAIAAAEFMKVSASRARA